MPSVARCKIWLKEQDMDAFACLYPSELVSIEAITEQTEKTKLVDNEDEEFKHQKRGR